MRISSLHLVCLVFFFLIATQYCKLLVLGITSKHLNHSLFSNIWMLKYFTSVHGCRPRFLKATIDSRWLCCWMLPFMSNICNRASFSEVLEYPISVDRVRETKLLITFESLSFNLAIPLQSLITREEIRQKLGDTSKVTWEGWGKPGVE